MEKQVIKAWRKPETVRKMLENDSLELSVECACRKGSEHLRFAVPSLTNRHHVVTFLSFISLSPYTSTICLRTSAERTFFDFLIHLQRFQRFFKKKYDTVLRKTHLSLYVQKTIDFCRKWARHLRGHYLPSVFTLWTHLMLSKYLLEATEKIIKDLSKEAVVKPETLTKCSNLIERMKR
jgi:hypothetical protein